MKQTKKAIVFLLKIEKSVAFLYTKHEPLELEIPQKIKFIVENLVRYVSQMNTTKHC